MSIFKRNIGIQKLLQKKSILLLGPRSTGKSFYVREQLDNVCTINLLKSSDFLKLSDNPSLIEEVVDANPRKIICIDEIQKIPALLDEAHRLIEEKKTRFLLTGSSARRLKATGVNLLAGRAWLATMCPLNTFEILQVEEYQLPKFLNFGSLPSVWTSSDPMEELDSYVQTYIDQEIKTEGLVRKIQPFLRFLKAAALHAGELVNYANIASDSGVPASTVREHYQILEDTLIGFTLEPWVDSKKRKAIATGKFYFFDIGVINQISGNFPGSEASTTWGSRFENFIINEVRCANLYQRRKQTLNFWRSASQYEVDLLFGGTAIEIKSTRRATDRDLAGLRALSQEGKHRQFILVSRDTLERKVDNIWILPYRKFLEALWGGEFA
jgi:predicted AAA+ superfamily ATPase